MYKDHCAFSSESRRNITHAYIILSWYRIYYSYDRSLLPSFLPSFLLSLLHSHTRLFLFTIFSFSRCVFPPSLPPFPDNVTQGRSVGRLHSSGKRGGREEETILLLSPTKRKGKERKGEANSWRSRREGWSGGFSLVQSLSIAN